MKAKGAYATLGILGLVASLLLVGLFFLSRNQVAGKDHHATELPSASISQPEATGPTPTNTQANVPDRLATPPRLAASYADELRDLEIQAQRGDVNARREIAQIYDRCFARSVSGQDYVDGLEQMAQLRGLPPDQIARLLHYGRAVDQRCASVEAGGIIPAGTVEYHLAKGAAAGDIASTVAFESIQGRGLNDETLADLANRALAQRDAAGLIALGKYIDPRREVFVRGQSKPVAVATLAMQACRVQPSLCGPTSDVVISACLVNFHCGANNYEELIRQHYLTPAEFARSGLDSQRLGRN